MKFLFCFFLCISLSAQDLKLPEKENFHLFLLIGQSNMAGRGKVAAEDKKVHPRVVTMDKSKKWKPAQDPIHFDKKSAGVGAGRTFGIQIAESNKKIVVGLIPSACGGSPISTWKVGGYHSQTKSHPYDDAIERAKAAMKLGTLKGFIWHQGESDCKEGKSEIYKEALKEMIHRFRKELNAEEIPFIIGQLGQFKERPWNEHKKAVDKAHKETAKELKNTYFVSSDGLKCKSDKTHFDAESMRAFGKRYAEMYLKVIK